MQFDDGAGATSSATFRDWILAELAEEPQPVIQVDATTVGGGPITTLGHSAVAAGGLEQLCRTLSYQIGEITTGGRPSRLARVLYRAVGQRELLHRDPHQEALRRNFVAL